MHTIFQNVLYRSDKLRAAARGFLLVVSCAWLLGCGSTDEPSRAAAPRVDMAVHRQLAKLEEQLGGPAGVLHYLSTESESEIRSTLARYGMGYVVHDVGGAAQSAGPSVDKQLPEGFWDGCPAQYTGPGEAGTFHDVEGKIYIVDNEGRPQGAYAYMPPIASARRQPLCQSTTSRWGSSGDPANPYDGGHLIAAQLGGWGYRANLVPQHRNFNRGNWAQLENAMATCGSRGPEDMMYRVTVDYPARDPARPNEPALIPVAFHLLLEDVPARQRAELDFDNAYQGGPNGTNERLEGVEFLRSHGCDGSPPNLDTPRAPGVIRFMAIGDSITHGAAGSHTWRYRLHEHLRAAGVPFDFVGPYDRAHLGEYAVGGWDYAHASTWGFTAMEAWHVVAEDVEIYEPDVLLVHLGTNDLTFLNGMPDGVAADVDRIIEAARSVDPGIDVVLAQIGDTGGLEDSETLLYAQALARIAQSRSTPQSRVAVANVAGLWNHETDTYDRTHPNERGEHVIAKAFADSLSSNLGIGAPYGPVPGPVGPPAPTGVVVAPNVVGPTTPFTVSWNRVVNPGVWTTYKVQIRNHRDFGFALVWESPDTDATSLRYGGPALGPGVYHVVVLSRDGSHERMSVEVPLEVRASVGPPAPSPTVAPGKVRPGDPFFVTWPRVVNPGIWTTYKVQVRNHQSFGFALVWESAETADLALAYTGPPLGLGVYHIVVVARDGTYETPSAPTPLEVLPYVGPPKPTGVLVRPPAITPGMTFFTTWDRVVNPGIWTTYKVQLRNHLSFGFALLWESPETADTAVRYDGPRLGLGTYHVVVVARDGMFETSSDVAELRVLETLGPPAPTGVLVSPNVIAASQTAPPGEGIIVNWPRVENPGIWTTYKVQLRTHQSFGFALLWESEYTPNTEVRYTGPQLGEGAYHVVVISTDGVHETISSPYLLTVHNAGSVPVHHDGEVTAYMDFARRREPQTQVASRFVFPCEDRPNAEYDVFVTVSEVSSTRMFVNSFSIVDKGQGLNVALLDLYSSAGNVLHRGLDPITARQARTVEVNQWLNAMPGVLQITTGWLGGEEPACPGFARVSLR
jgi:lysophospholipase L1-like esterase